MTPLLFAFVTGTLLTGTLHRSKTNALCCPQCGERMEPVLE